MDGKTYLAILKENGYQRSWLVRLLEQQAAIFEKNGLHDEAEQVKWWIILYIAPAEKEQGTFI